MNPEANFLFLRSIAAAFITLPCPLTQARRDFYLALSGAALARAVLDWAKRPFLDLVSEEGHLCGMTLRLQPRREGGWEVSVTGGVFAPERCVIGRGAVSAEALWRALVMADADEDTQRLLCASYYSWLAERVASSALLDEYTQLVLAAILPR